MVRVLVLAAALAFGLLLSGCASLPPPRAQPFAGKTVVITGASSGFGRGMARAFSQRGANVVLAARRTELIEEAAAEARANGVRALAVTTDVSRPADMDRLAQAAVAEFGKVDVWINNAGVTAIGRLDETPLADHERIIDVNLKGVIYGSRLAVAQFRRQGQGVLINMGSVESRVPLPYQTSYVASKHGVLGLSSALRQELKVKGERNIHVVVVMPWAADTPIWRNAANYTGRESRAPLLDPAQTVVDAVVFAALHPRREVAPGIKAKGALVGHRLTHSGAEAFAAAVYHAVQIEQAPAAPNTAGAVQQPLPGPPAEIDAGFRARWRAEDAARRKGPDR